MAIHDDATAPSTTHEPTYRPADLPERLNCSAATGWRVRQDPTFPKPARISPRIVIWTESQIAAWLASRQGAR